MSTHNPNQRSSKPTPTKRTPTKRSRQRSRSPWYLPLLALVHAWLRGELARRLGRLTMLLAALTAVVLVLYAKGEAPAALARAATAAGRSSASAGAGAGAVPAAGHVGRGGRPGLPAAAQPTPAPGPAAAAPAAAAAASRPATAAVAWYATKHHLPPGKVRALQQDRRSDREVRVLVLADGGGGKLTTALVTVRRDGKGRWAG